VEGPACENRITQGLLKENATAAPWILDPTAADARVRGGPRRGRGPQVHGGPVFKREGVHDLDRPSQISRPWTLASDGRR
jgi:hypothetical protein